MRRANLIALLIFVGLLAWVFSLDTRRTRGIQETISGLFSPFTRAGAVVQEKATAPAEQNLRPAAELQAENERLAQEVARLRIYEQQVARMQNELNELNSYFNFKNRHRFKLTAARIIVRRNSAWYRQATIDKGSADGIAEGLPVIVPDGLVGRVAKVFKNESEILFITDELCKVGAQIEGTRERGILQGVRVSPDKRPDLRLLFLSRDVGDSLKGRKVYTMPEYITFPPNILLGTIVDFRAGDASTEAIVQPAVRNLDSLKYVFVMEPGSEEPLPPPVPPR